ncbi:hypothetical protein ABIA94_003223 [Bradyrhizobium sp. LA7.1]
MKCIVGFLALALLVGPFELQAAELAPSAAKHKVLYCTNGSTCKANCNGSFCTLFKCFGGAWQRQGDCIQASDCPPNYCPTTISPRVQ